jgi:hypothetical protein
MYGTVEEKVVREELIKGVCPWDMAHALMRHTMIKTMSSIHLSVRVLVPHFESEKYIGIVLFS